MASEKVTIYCPNCGKKDSMWGGKVVFLSQKEIDFINTFHEPKKEAYCNGDNCGFVLLHKYKNVIFMERENLKSQLNQIGVDFIPVITLPNPAGWEYDILDMVTAQTTTGTGAITEIFAQVADFMGDQSERHNDKLYAAVNLCKRQLRIQAVTSGGNAIIGCDIDISTAGTGNGLIIVCMSGTMINIKNMVTIYPDLQKQIAEISALQSKLADLDKYPKN